MSDEQALLEKISNIADETAKVKAACFFLFTKEELISCSRTGKRSAKCLMDPRPALNQQKLSLLKKVMMDMGMTIDKFNSKLENIQKVLRR